MNDLLSVVAEMREAVLSLRIHEPSIGRYAQEETAAEIKDWADRLESLAPAGLSDGQREALEEAIRNAEHDAGDFDDSDEDTKHARHLYEALVKLRRLAAAPALATQQTGAVSWEFRWANEGDDSLLLVSHPEHGGVGVWKDAKEPRTIPENMLYALAKDLMNTSPGARVDDALRARDKLFCEAIIDNMESSSEPEGRMIVDVQKVLAYINARKGDSAALNTGETK